MLAIAFIVVWVVVGVVLFFIAMRGGPRGARATLQTQSKAGRRIVHVGLAIVYLGAVVAIPLAVILDNPDVARTAPGGIELTKSEAEARDTFAITCGQCHTLEAANAVGRVGPNLDELKPSAAVVLNAVMNGKASGNGTMPSGLLDEKQAREVAQFIATSVGSNPDLPPEGSTPPTAQGGSTTPQSEQRQSQRSQRETPAEEQQAAEEADAAAEAAPDAVESEADTPNPTTTTP
jgi:cytochrome c553